MNPTIIDKTDIKAGDVLLCFAQEMAEKSEHISSGYSHAAICLNSKDVFESASSGVQNTTIDKLFNEYSHIVVLRSPDLWNSDRIQKLNDFAKAKQGCSFNSLGIQRFDERKKKNEETSIYKIHQFYDGEIPPVSPDKKTYFCSELVVSVFIHAEIISPSATMVFDPQITSPQGIGNDLAFGFFTGYIIPYDEYEIPTDDFFYHTSLDHLSQDEIREQIIRDHIRDRTPHH